MIKPNREFSVESETKNIYPQIILSAGLFCFLLLSLLLLLLLLLSLWMNRTEQKIRGQSIDITMVKLGDVVRNWELEMRDLYFPMKAENLWQIKTQLLFQLQPMLLQCSLKDVPRKITNTSPCTQGHHVHWLVKFTGKKQQQQQQQTKTFSTRNENRYFGRHFETVKVISMFLLFMIFFKYSISDPSFTGNFVWKVVFRGVNVDPLCTNQRKWKRSNELKF